MPSKVGGPQSSTFAVPLLERDLLTEGIILHFFGMARLSPCISWGGGVKTILRPEFILPQDLINDENFFIDWGNDGYIEKLSSNGNEDGTVHDLLLVAVKIDTMAGSRVTLKVKVLHLYWEDETVFRSGVVSPQRSAEVIEQF